MSARLVLCYCASRSSILIIKSVAFAALFLCAQACQGSRSSRTSPEHAREFARIARAIDQALAAPPDHNSAEVAALSALSCQQFCELQAVCGKALQRQFDARRRLSAARLLLDSDASTEASTLAAAQVLTAQRELQQVRPDLERCIAKKSELQRALP